MFRGSFIILLILLSGPAILNAQPKGKLIRIVNAETLSFSKEKNNAKILQGNVICEHEGTLLHCDTAYLYEELNRMVAMGHILITKGDSIRVTGEKLVYEGKTRLATLERNVRCTERDMTLTTDLLIFDVSRSIASYYNGGTLVNRDNTLISRKGHYFSASKEAAFHYDVVLTNPGYKMNSDTLKYRITNKTAYFLGPSIISSSKDYIYCENGWYDTDKEKSAFSRNALLVTAQQKLKGDSLVYDRNLQVGRAFRNVTLIDTSQKSILYGQYIEYHEKNSEAWVVGRPVYARLMEKDSLFLGADTLYHRDIDSVNNFLKAYRHVRLYKKDMQAACDSATLNSKDSLLTLFNAPLLWTQNSQATAKVIQVELNNNKIKGFRLDGKAFLIQLGDTTRKSQFDQLAGRVITGYMEKDTVRRIIVNGNAEILYYPRNNDKPIGLNRTTSAEIWLWFEGGQVEKVTVKPLTEGKVEPIRQVDIENARLKGFNWQYHKRPRSRHHLH